MNLHHILVYYDMMRSLVLPICIILYIFFKKMYSTLSITLSLNSQDIKPLSHYCKYKN